MKVRPELRELFESWREDPCWELPDSEGYEAFRPELEELAAAQKNLWQQEEEQRQLELATKLNIPLESLEEYETIMHQANLNKDYARKIFLFYLVSNNVKLNQDTVSEIQGAVDCLIKSAIASIKAELLVEARQLTQEKSSKGEEK